jgi:hypothetical protein
VLNIPSDTTLCTRRGHAGIAGTGCKTLLSRDGICLMLQGQGVALTRRLQGHSRHKGCHSLCYLLLDETY